MDEKVEHDSDYKKGMKVMKKRCSVKVVLSVMALLVVCLLAFKSEVAYANSENKCSIYEGDYKILTVQTEDDVEWNVSGNHCVRVMETNNKKKVLLIARKAGKAKITANYGSKEKTWNISVKKDRKSHLSLKKATVKQEKVVVKTVANIFAGKKKFEFEYGKDYTLYQYTDGKWEELKFSPNYAFVSNVSVTLVKKNSKAKVNIIYTLDVSNFENWNMESGVYKLVANTNLPTGKEYVLFEI